MTDEEMDCKHKLQMKRQIALISAVTLVVLLLRTGSLTAYQSIRAEQWRKQEEKERTGVVLSRLPSRKYVLRFLLLIKIPDHRLS